MNNWIIYSYLHNYLQLSICIHRMRAKTNICTSHTVLSLAGLHKHSHDCVNVRKKKKKAHSMTIRYCMRTWARQYVLIPASSENCQTTAFCAPNICKEKEQREGKKTPKQWDTCCCHTLRNLGVLPGRARIQITASWCIVLRKPIIKWPAGKQ